MGYRDDLPVSAHGGDTLPTLAATYHVPLWVLTQVNNLSEAAVLTKGARIIVPRYLVPMAAPRRRLIARRVEQTLICGA